MNAALATVERLLQAETFPHSVEPMNPVLYLVSEETVHFSAGVKLCRLDCLRRRHSVKLARRICYGAAFAPFDKFCLRFQVVDHLPGV